MSIRCGTSIKLRNGGRLGESGLSSPALKPIAPETDIVDGKDHDEGGELVFNRNGEPQAELEDKEIAFKRPDGDVGILSRKLGFADLAKRVMSTEEFEEFASNPLDTENPLNFVFNEQEKYKRNKGINN